MKTGETIVTRESAWDASARGRALRLVEYEASLCSCGCGLPMSEAHKKQPFLIDSFTCYAGQQLERARRQARENAETRNLPDGWDDGKHYYATPVEDQREGRNRGN